MHYSLSMCKLVWNTALPFWKLLVFETLLGISETFLCSVSALHLKTILLQDVHQLLMLSAGILMYLKQILFPLVTFKTFTIHIVTPYMAISPSHLPISLLPPFSFPSQGFFRDSLCFLEAFAFPLPAGPVLWHLNCVCFLYRFEIVSGSGKFLCLAYATWVHMFRGSSDLFYGATVLCFHLLCWYCEVPFWLGFLPLVFSSIILNSNIVMLELWFRFNISLYWTFMYCACYFLLIQCGFHYCCSDL
jgi:hypothetical protein